MHRIADAISTEARGKYHEAQRHDPIPEVSVETAKRP
jgi:hypothetical protein